MYKLPIQKGDRFIDKYMCDTLAIEPKNWNDETDIRIIPKITTITQFRDEVRRIAKYFNEQYSSVKAEVDLFKDDVVYGCYTSKSSWVNWPNPAVCCENLFRVLTGETEDMVITEEDMKQSEYCGNEPEKYIKNHLSYVNENNELINANNEPTKIQETSPQEIRIGDKFTHNKVEGEFTCRLISFSEPFNPSYDEIYYSIVNGKPFDFFYRKNCTKI